MKKQEQEMKEDFCLACLAAPLALAGAGMAGVGTKGAYGKKKKVLLWSGLSMTVIGAIVTIVYLMKCKSCR